MPLIIPTTTLPDPPDFEDFTLGANLVGGFLQVFGNSAEVEIFFGIHGQRDQLPATVLPPGSYNVGRSPSGSPLAGLRARNAVAGLPADIAGYFWTESDPTLAFVGTPAAQGVAVLGVPVGSVLAWGGSTAPTGYLLCEGQAVSRVTYADLFGVIGTIYGAGDGATTFNVPDLRGRMPVGLGTNAAVNALGDNEGVATVGNRRPQHRHTPHTHTYNEPNYNASFAGPAVPGTTSTFVNNTGASDGGSGVGTDALDAPAFLTLNFIIAAGV